MLNFYRHYVKCFKKGRKQLAFHVNIKKLRKSPTKALEQHIKRVCYQSNCWNRALIPIPDLPTPADWGCKRKLDGNQYEAAWLCSDVVARKGAMFQGCPQVHCTELLFLVIIIIIDSIVLLLDLKVIKDY